jgi:sugar phosphate isomerase/epimerase
MFEIPPALQLYSVREDCARDLPRTLKSLSEMGYKGVEFAGYHGYSAVELKRLLKNADLKVVGTHININSLLGEELNRTIKFNKILGNQFLIVPSLPSSMISSRTAWLETAQLMNSIAKRIKPEGLRVGYHNHPNARVFQRINGELPWDLLFGATSPDVLMQLDAGNALSEGLSPDDILEILSRYPNRSVTVHLKDFSSTNKQALLGEGEMKWKEFFKLCRNKGGTKWYIIEQENCAVSSLECARLCLRNFFHLN